ncbi:hypothetical protein E2C01_033101 [Portunus trituberculatus]|uniref:Uncharacterized protein n=1 Tax=Portunus trituberculatus TaxID=210409 RepID=A0A5B7EXP7_PORTR|nr:hypothetical protein [Portunus trituberculatus]
MDDGALRSGKVVEQILSGVLPSVRWCVEVTRSLERSVGAVPGVGEQLAVVGGREVIAVPPCPLYQSSLSVIKISRQEKYHSMTSLEVESDENCRSVLHCRASSSAPRAPPGHW